MVTKQYGVGNGIGTPGMEHSVLFVVFLPHLHLHPRRLSLAPFPLCRHRQGLEVAMLVDSVLKRVKVVVVEDMMGSLLVSMSQWDMLVVVVVVLLRLHAWFLTYVHVWFPKNVHKVFAHQRACPLPKIRL